MRFRQDMSARLTDLKPTVVRGNASEITTRAVRVANSHPMMARITVMGCGLNCVMAGFGVGQPAFEATVAALAAYGHAGETAGRAARGPDPPLDACANVKTTPGLAQRGQAAVVRDDRPHRGEVSTTRLETTAAVVEEVPRGGMAHPSARIIGEHDVRSPASTCLQQRGRRGEIGEELVDLGQRPDAGRGAALELRTIRHEKASP